MSLPKISSRVDGIVKVQVSMQTTMPHRMMLIYNEDRSVQKEDPASDEVLLMMNGALKEYFYYRMNDGNIELIRLAPKQDW